MNKKVKHTFNVVLASVALAMGIAVVVLSMLDEYVTTRDLIIMLAIAIVALGRLTLNKEEDKNKKAE